MTVPGCRGRGRRSLFLISVACALVAMPHAGAAQPADKQAIERNIAALIAQYPKHLERIDGNALVWKDGTRMVIDDGRGAKSHEVLLNTADLKDMFFSRYPLGRSELPPALNAD